MNNIEYLTKKNDIVYRATKEILIPEDQIVDEKPVKLDISIYLVSDNCTYCMSRYSLDFGTTDCSTCPMFIAGNACENDDSTWAIAEKKWDEDTTKEFKDELIELTKEYNKSNGFTSS